MASTQEYLDYVLELLADVDGITTRKMMGEYLIYLDGRVVGGIYDDSFLLKPDDRLDTFFPDAQRRLPYEGSKTMMIIVETDSPSLLNDAFEAIRD